MKHRIQKTFRADMHYVWCSPIFHAAALPLYAIGRMQPDTSDPVSIYRRMLNYVKQPDDHNELVAGWKTGIKARALTWFNAGEVSEETLREITAIVDRSVPTDWRPLIYVIPASPLGDRVKLVPRSNRASHEPEYTIEDLRSEEFQIIEPLPWN